MAAVNREPMTAPHRHRNDALIALGALAVSVLLGFVTRDGRAPDAVGWVLLVASGLPVAVRRRHPLLALCAFIAIVLPYHLLDYTHTASMPQTVILLYTVAATGRPLRTLVVGAGLISLLLTVVFGFDSEQGLELLRISGWIIAVLVFGVDARYYRGYVAAIVERAVRAERTREEEAARRVAEERLRIARDLHDLLAHSITLIGVQTSVAAHILAVDPDRLDRAAIGRALDDISGTCRSARGELRATLEVLRAGESARTGEQQPPAAGGPLPGLDGLTDLAAAARSAGARVDLVVETRSPPPAVGAAVYRIVQESLTNAVRHGGSSVAVEIGVREERHALSVSVHDDGGTGAPEPAGAPGYGLVGMRERARSVGGTLDAGPRDGGGFSVRAVLPLQLPVGFGGSGGAVGSAESEGAAGSEGAAESRGAAGPAGEESS
ncbi:sensor histidine kinase [Streptomyces triticagri]|uniref:sensor histidine kinase n=1 Tax=Streptomyces triticagri TaxID=2293568 RepID=UPI000FFC1C7F|nr:sensor histidine kinase [Streptomyces triticagri]